MRPNGLEAENSPGVWNLCPIRMVYYGYQT